MAQCEAQLDKLGLLAYSLPSPGEPPKYFELLKDLLRACPQESSTSCSRSYTPLEEWIIDFIAHSIEAKIPKMAVENNVYLAKLAEQAERYEGKIVTPL